MRRLAHLILLSAAMAAAACSPDSGGSPRQGSNAGSGPIPDAPRGVVRINISATPFSLDPTLSTDIPGSKVLRHLFEGLVRLDGDAQPQPGLAESWESNDDATVWTFHLRKDARWHNGDPVTAQDFLYSYKRILNPEVEAQYAYMVFGYLKNGKAYFESGGEGDFGAKALDDHTLELTLEGPTPYFPSMLGHPSWYAVHPPTVEKHGNMWSHNAETYMGNGPYRLSEWRAKDRVIALKADTYFARDEVHFDQIIFRMIENESTQVAAFESGELDITDGVPRTEVDRWRERPEFFQSPYLGCYYVAFNMTKPPFDDIALRRAFSLAINRRMVVEKLTKRGELPADGFVPIGIKLEDGTDFRDMSGALIDVDDYEANVEEAKRILREAGYGTEKKIPRIEYLYNNNEEHQIIGEFLQNLWKTHLGADVRLQAVEFKVKQQRGTDKNYEAMRNGWIADYVYPLSFLDLFMKESLNNDMGMDNPRYDELIREARREPEPRKAFELLAEAERILIVDECAMAPIYYYSGPLLMRPEIKGVARNALGDLDVSRAWREGEK